MDPRNLDELRSVEELVAYQKEVRARIVELDDNSRGLPFDDDEREEYAGLTETDQEINRRVVEFNARTETVRRIASEGHVERTTDAFQTVKPARVPDIYDVNEVRRTARNAEDERGMLRSNAMKILDSTRVHSERISEEDAKENAERLMLQDGDSSAISRHIILTSSPTYRRAFGKTLMHQHLSSEEQRVLGENNDLLRAMSLAGSAGGFAVPFELDPTVMLTSSGVTNPIRQISRVERITVDEWRGITSAGITAAFAAEATETTDNSPVLVQPTVSTEKAQAFVQYSIEIGQDWSGLQAAMGDLLADAKDVLEAGKFVTGTGTNEPFGVLTGTTNTVAAAAGADAFTLANLYSLVGALPPRYRNNAAFLGDLLIYNRIRQFDTVGSSAAVWVEGLQADLPARLFGKPAYEASEMPNDAALNNKFLVIGDFARGYLIVDRVGLTVETIPHVFGANRRPTGERGLYAYWRVGAKVIDANALRALIGTA